MRDLDSIVRVLGQYEQRATYGAVAGVLGSTARTVMGRRARSPFYSWVVNASTGMPTNYKPSECHPSLLARSRVIDDATGLYHWLRDPR